ncbi:hypothetical protein BDZ45DRAFT_722883, partial [Acephala macrosclerotiorum]
GNRDYHSTTPAAQSCNHPGCSASRARPPNPEHRSLPCPRPPPPPPTIDLPHLPPCRLSRSHPCQAASCAWIHCRYDRSPLRPLPSRARKCRWCLLALRPSAGTWQQPGSLALQWCLCVLQVLPPRPKLRPSLKYHDEERAEEINGFWDDGRT